MFHHILRLAPLCLFALAPVEALAQRADDNATTQAEDAFGSSIGNESVGLYNPYDARGFSPIDAGNARIEGLYFDQQSEPTARLVESTRVRVGLTTLGFLFPAPTGIADYGLRKPGDKRVISVVAGGTQYYGPFVEVDAKLPINERLGMTAGAGRRHDEFFDGSDGDFATFGASLRYRPSDGIELTPFIGRVYSWNEESAPFIITGGDFVPPRIERRSFYSQEWADNKAYSQNHGLIAKSDLGHWQIQAGLFQSRYVSERNYTELITGVTRAGTGERLVVARPGQRFASTSGELRVSYDFIESNRKHILTGALRGRDVKSRFGGSQVVSLGPGALGVEDQEPMPRFTFGPQDRDRVKQKTFGVAYQGLWANVGELNAGLQRSDYRKTTEQQLPVFARSVRRDEPWLWNASVAAYVSKSIALYAGATRGLEESGTAPAEATNRFAVLPAIRTRQVEAGARIVLMDSLKLVTGLFDVRKPYFALDSTRLYRELGEQRHRGLETSLTGEVMDGMTVVFGMILMRPRVTGEPVERGEIGRRPVGPTTRYMRGSVDYRLPFWDGVSVDAMFQNVASRMATVSNVAATPGRSVLDLGARYSFDVDGHPTTLRLRWANITNTFGYQVFGDRTFRSNNARHITLFIATDL